VGTASATRLAIPPIAPPTSFGTASSGFGTAPPPGAAPSFATASGDPRPFSSTWVAIPSRHYPLRCNQTQLRPAVGQEAQDRLVRLLGPLQLRHVAALELQVPGIRHRVAHVSLEADRNQRVLSTPDEQALWLERAESGPEAVPPMRGIEVDVAGGGVEGSPPARSQV